MNFFSKKAVSEILKKHKISPSKGLGQNFLVDKFALKKIISAANLDKKEIVLEIGPGIGTLTQELASRTKQVIAIEKDSSLIKVLKETLQGFKNIKLVQKDVLKIPFSTIKNVDKIVANLPFYITAHIIRRFLENNFSKPMIFVVQKEVAKRICAKPMASNLLSISVQFYALPKIIDYISKKSFWPTPKVDAAILQIVPHDVKSAPYLRYGKNFNNIFFKIIRAAFSHPRKQLVNNLSDGLKLKKEEVVALFLKNKIGVNQRAENIIIDQWITIAHSLKQEKHPCL